MTTGVPALARRGERAASPTDVTPTDATAHSPAGVRAWVRQPAAWIGLVIVALATAYRVWSLQQTWFFVDDLLIINSTVSDGISSLWTPYNGHLMPGGRLLGSLTVAGGSWNYGIAIAEIGVLFAITGLAFLRLLITLFGPRLAIVMPLTILLLSPWTTSVTLWWSAAINQLPALAVTALSLNAHVWWLRTGRRRHLVAAVAWVVVGLAFAELALLALIPIAFVTLAYFTSGSLTERARDVWARHRSGVVTYAVLALAYVALFKATGSGKNFPATVRPIEFVANLFGDVVPSAFIGGPARWDVLWAGWFYVAPTSFVRIGGVLAIGLVVALSALTRERAMRAWGLPLIQLVICLVLTVWNRRLFGSDVILELRFSSPAVFGVALALALAFLPVVGAVESSVRRAANPFVDRWQPAVVATLAFSVFAVATANSFPLRHVPQGERAQDYFGNFERSLAEHHGRVPMVFGELPFSLGGPDLGFARYRDRLEFPAVAQDGDLYTVSTDGSVVPADLNVSRVMTPPDDATTSSCSGYLLTDSRAIPLDGPVMGWVWRIRFTYDANTDTPVVIQYGDESTPTTLRAGEHTIELAAPGGYDRIGFSGLDDGATVCVTGLAVGETTPGD